MNGKEKWKSIPGFCGLYEASNFGRIRSVDGKVTSNALHETRKWRGRIMKQKNRYQGNKRVDKMITLWKDGKPYYFLVARIIALTWCAGYKDGLTVNHKDGDPLNNNSENLEWITRSENIKLGFKNGLYASNQKPVKLEKGEKIIRFASQTEASRFLGKNHGYINSILKRDGIAISSKGEKIKVTLA